MLQRSSKSFGSFLDVRKAFDSVWIDGVLHKLFYEFDTKGRVAYYKRSAHLYYSYLSGVFDSIRPGGGFFLGGSINISEKSKGFSPET